MNDIALSPEEARRYARQLVLKGFGGTSQQRLKAARVLVVGAGALGSPVIAYLSAAGVGTLGVVDNDQIALSNLQRQVIHTSAGIGQNKTESAERFARDLNPHVRFIAHTVRLDAGNAAALMEGYDVIIDGSDSFSTRKIVAETAERLEKPLVAGAVSIFDGQITALLPGADNPRFRDLYPETPDDAGMPSCEQAGVMGATTGVMGTLMASEAIKLLTGIGEPLLGRLLLYDGRAARFTELLYRRGA